MDKDLENAVKELEDETNKSEQKKEEESHVGLLAKSVEVLSKAVSSILKKSEDGKDEKKELTAEVSLSKSLSESGQGDVIDGAEVLKAFQEGISKSLATVEHNLNAQIGQVQEAVKTALEVMLPLVKSQLAIHKMVEASPKSTPMLGVITNGKGREDEQVRKSTGSFEDAFLSIKRAVVDKKLSADHLGRFQSRPEDTLRIIPVDVRKSYDIPDTLHKAA